jgi:hypothetical protein
MVDMSMVKPFVHGLFEGSGKNILSKQELLSMVVRSDMAVPLLPFFNDLPNTDPYTERRLTETLEAVMTKNPGESAAVSGEIRSKIGV